MATGRTRDEATLAEGYSAWLRGPGGRPDAAVREVRRPSAGHSNETLILTLDAGGRSERQVLRLPPLTPLVPDYDLRREATVLETLAGAGLPVPCPIVFEPDATHLGVPFLVLPMVEGHVVGEAPVLDPWLSEAPPAAQARVEEGFLAVLAAVHRYPVAGSGLERVLRSGSSADELAWWAEYLRWAFGGSPPATLVSVLDHLRATAPGTEPRRELLWGDARLGNVIYDEDRGVRAALDWELATIGSGEADLAWYLALSELLFSFVGRRLPGFLDRDAVVADYERRRGRPMVDLEWHETFALLRSAAINARIARMTDRGRGGGEDDPVLGYLRRRLDIS
jgi:aminoglycoside phosphotransferase (APT) family kinase protein